MDFVFQEFAAPLPPQEQKALVATEEKANPAFSGYVVFNDTPLPVSSPRDIRKYVKEAYQTDDTLYKVVKYCAGNGAAIPPKLYTDKTLQKEITDHPLLEKLESPNPEQTGIAYREAILSYLLIAGNAYQYAIRKGKSGPPDELWVLEPDKVRAIPSPTRGIIGWEFDDFPKEKNPIPAENIGHTKFWNPSSPIYGQSPLEAIALSIDQQTSARKWNLSLLQNYAKSGGTWIAPMPLSPNDYSKTLEKLREIYAGFANAGKTALLDGGMQWVNQGMSPTDLDWLPGMQYNAAAIANGYDLAPQLIGNTSSTTYDNMDQAKAASYTEAIFPVNDKVYALWSKWLLPMYPDLKNAYLYYDKESIEVLQAIIQAKNSAKIDQATKIYLAGGCDLYTYQQIVGKLIGIKPDDNGKGIYRIQNVLVTSNKLQEYAEQSLTTPAAPPLPQSEPIELPPAEPGQEPDPEQPGNAQQQKPPARNKPPKKPVKPAEQTQEGKMQESESEHPHVLHKKAAGDQVTHLLWECAPGACEFCLENDGVLISVDDSFPNGCDSPDDCHRFCKCTATEIALPDNVDESDLQDMESDTIITLYAVGIIASRHDRDVAEQQQQDEEDEEDDEDYAKHIHDLAAARARKRRKREYQALMEALP